MENFNLTAHVVDDNRNQSNHLRISGSFESIEQQLKDLAALASSESNEGKKKLHFTIANESGKQLIGNVYPIELSGNLIDLKKHYKVPIGTDELWAEQKKWERELSKRTELSDGLTNTGIDEKHAHYYRTYFAAHQIELEEKNDFFQTIDLLDKYEYLPNELKPIVEHYSNVIESFIDMDGKEYEDIYSTAEEFKQACEEIGYTLEYGLDAQPYFLRPISIEEQLILESKINDGTEISISETIENKKESLKNNVDNNIDFFIKNSLPNEIEILKQYVLAKEEEYDNRVSDGTSKLRQNNFKELINSSDPKALEVINNVIEVADKYLNEEPYLNRIYRIDNIKNVIYDHEKKDLLLSILPDSLNGFEISEKHKEQLIKNGEVTIISPVHDDELLVQFSLTKNLDIKMWLPSGEEDFIKYSELQNSSKEKNIRLENLDLDQLYNNPEDLIGKKLMVDNIDYEVLSVRPNNMPNNHKVYFRETGEPGRELTIYFSDIKRLLSDNVSLNIEKKNEIDSKDFKVGSLATAKVETGIFKGKIIEIADNKITIENLKGETVTASKNEVYQFFQGQKYDRSEIQSLFSSDPAGIKFSFLEKNDITKLMRGELTNTVFKGYTVKDGKDYFYEFKFRAEYSKIQGKLTLKPYWKNKNEDMPVAAFGTALTKEQIQEASQGKSIIVDGISRESKPFSVKVHYDRDLNAFIADKYVNNAATIKITSESTIKEDSFKEKRGPKI